MPAVRTQRGSGDHALTLALLSDAQPSLSHTAAPVTRQMSAVGSTAIPAAASSSAVPAAPVTSTPTATASPTPAAAAAAASAPSPYIIPLPPSLPPCSIRTSSLLIPPLSFSLVCPGIYRSACPSQRNFDFLAGLGLKSIVYLCADAYPAESAAHFHSAGVNVRSFKIDGNREPFCSIDSALLAEALLFALDARNHPLLVHCSKGRHRTGVFVGVLRRLGGQSLASAFAEYRTFIGAGFVLRDLDRLAIETHDVEEVKRRLKERVEEEEFRPDWIEEELSAGTRK